MTEAEKAYAEAERMIAEAKREGETFLDFNTSKTHALTDLPPSISDLGLLGMLDLDNTQITDAALENLSRLTGLQTLYLNSTQITDAGLETLSGLTGLQTLYLRNTQITDAGLETLSGLTGLQTLSLSSTQITDAGLEILSGLTGLQTLSLNSTQITDAGLESLSGLTGLLSLHLGNTQITDAGLETLSGLAGLTDLKIQDTQVTDAGFARISGLTKLTDLNLRNTQITDASVAQISKLTGLRLLNITKTQINDLRPLRALTGLLEPMPWGGITFADCAAAKADPKIAEIDAIEDNKARAQALFDLIDAGWVPPFHDAKGIDLDAARTTAPVPDRRPAPLEVEVGEDSIDLAHGSLPKADANTRAAMGWEALMEYRHSFAASFNISNYAPLPKYLTDFDTAMGGAYDATRAIRIGIQGRRFVALSMDAGFLKNLPEGAGSDLKNFAAEVLIYLNRFPDWVAYREDADDVSAQAIKAQVQDFEDIQQALNATPEASDAVKAEYAAEVALGTSATATAEEATGIVATTGELARALAQADKDRHKRNLEGAKHASDLWNKTIVAPLGMPKMVALRMEAPMRRLSEAHPGRLGWIKDWYDVTFGKQDDRG